MVCAAALLGAGHAWATDITPAETRALTRASDAVVGVRSVATDGALTAATLGAVREGSGVVIGADDLVLTIGYLVLEAEQVELVLDDGRVLPARIIANDAATGFGLVQSLAPLGLEPVPLGDDAGLQPGQPLMIVSGGEDGGISIARLVSRRPFAGTWEYQIDTALFTAPARPDHSGAALFNVKGELLGIGSLLVHDAQGPPPANASGTEERIVGNMFVPVDLLKPILGELRSRGASARSRRAWMGVDCIEQDGTVRVVAVGRRSPAEQAGVQPGDRIERIDGQPIDTLAMLWKQLWAGNQPERDVALDIRRGDQARRVTVRTVDGSSVYKRAKGI